MKTSSVHHLIDDNTKTKLFRCDEKNGSIAHDDTIVNDETVMDKLRSGLRTRFADGVPFKRDSDLYSKSHDSDEENDDYFMKDGAQAQVAHYHSENIQSK